MNLMSKALKCDRCKRCFDADNLPEGREFATLPDGYYLQTSVNVKNNEVSYREYVIDLCPTCTDHFIKFMAKKPYAHYASPIRQVIHLEDKEKQEAYDEGFKDGLLRFAEKDEIIRCKYCRHVDFCEFSDGPDWYCAGGKKK